MRLIILASLIALAGCGANVTDAQKAQLEVTGQAFAMSLASVAAANSSTVSDQVQKGALFCQKAQASGPLVVALANIYGAPVTVVNQTSQAVADACALVGAVPVAPPADPAVVPVQGSATTLPAV